jgi:hypothetical protein
MRIALFGLLLISSLGLAQGQAVYPLVPNQPIPFVKPPASTPAISLERPGPRNSNPASPPPEQLSKYAAYVKRCLSSHDPPRNRITMRVRIGTDGRIVGEPQVMSPIDSDEFRDDVAASARKLHECEPFPVPPSKDDAGYIQELTFDTRAPILDGDRAVDAAAGER